MKRIVSILLLAGLAFAACSRDDLEDPLTEGGREICFVPSSAMGHEAAEPCGVAVLHAADSCGTLLVGVEVTEGIAPSATRGLPVSKESFYDAFRVLACWKRQGVAVNSAFYMNERVVRRGDGLWAGENPCYWPDPTHTLRFAAYAPADAPFDAVPDRPDNLVLAYTVPARAKDQKDVVTAVTEEFAGDFRAAVPLAFRHVCTAVRFVVGGQMQQGVIRSVALRGVHGSGHRDLSAGVWRLDPQTTDFELHPDRSMTGGEAAGSGIFALEDTFMMLPQTLPQGALVEVVFEDTLCGTVRRMTAPIGGSLWPEGRTVTYKLSVSPDYELDFASEPAVQDAHYVICPVCINASPIPGGWTLSSSSPSVTLRTELTELEKQGYWIEEDRGTQRIESTLHGEGITVYAFLEENSSEQPREVVLTLRPTNAPSVGARTLTLVQHAPAWNGDLGCERIEQGDFPWGFMWPKGTSLTYKLPGFGDIFARWYASLIIDITGMANYDYVEIRRTFLSISSITIHFDRLKAVDVCLSPDDGVRNTIELCNYKGVGDASVLMEGLESLGLKPDKELPLNPTQFAARMCVMKNRFHKRVESQGGNTAEIPVLNKEDLKWYLPARNEAPLMQDADFPLAGWYWTSTAAGNDNEQAFGYLAGNASADAVESRNRLLHVRAVRRRDR